ncbi:DEAD/DEAH box helicase [Macromonas nakdongensis]|uniref:DEAD/DEAH box helicase n=1 Tax=Macromonas nakdongensis TaxID=1843082 RepID=UPI000C332B39|nr:DEAD/DEAH box helicase [Macromonas nakdongensis]
MPFATLGLHPAFFEAIQALGYAAPTPVQTEAIPAVLRGTDVLAQAQTGSGKTAAYALPLLQRLWEHPMARGPHPVRTLVLVPTRELAQQVGDLLREVLRHLPRSTTDGPPPLKVAVVFGGVSINPQMMGLRGGADLVVATPGRLLDLVDSGALWLNKVQHLVLDEADRLLDLGFADELRAVLALLPARRQNLLLSATFPAEVQGLADALLRAPQRIQVPETAADLSRIEQHAYRVDTARRATLLRHLIDARGWRQTLVFVASQYAAEHLAFKLNRGGLSATAFHGGLTQGARREVLAGFKHGEADVLVTTDLAARGIDIAQLPVVVNFDLPRSAVDYVHRIGRTGRAGASGLAVSLVTAARLAHWQLIQKRQQLALPLEVVPGFEPTEADVPAAQDGDGNGGVKGKRPSKKDKLRAAAALAAHSNGPR